MDRANLLSELANHRRKAEQMRNFHATLGDEFQEWARRVSTFVLVGTALSTLTIFMDWEAVFGPSASKWRLVGGVLAALVFVAESVSRHKRWDDSAVEHHKAVTAWTQWIRSTKDVETHAASMSDEDLESHSKTQHELYRETAAATPHVPERRFLELKAAWRKKLWVSRELDHDTGETPDQIAKRFHAQGSP